MKSFLLAIVFIGLLVWLIPKSCAHFEEIEHRSYVAFADSVYASDCAPLYYRARSVHDSLVVDVYKPRSYIGSESCVQLGRFTTVK